MVDRARGFARRREPWGRRVLFSNGGDPDEEECLFLPCNCLDSSLEYGGFIVLLHHIPILAAPEGSGEVLEVAVDSD
jgi:hypothetical protein